MILKNTSIVFLLSLLTCFQLKAQALRAEEPKVSEVLIKLAEVKMPIDEVVRKLNDRFWGEISFSFKAKTAAPKWGIYTLVYSPASLDAASVASKLKQMSEIKAALPNRSIESRTEPNDASYSLQWNLQKINIEPVWDVTVGGTSAAGDTIVVCIIERFGYDISHEDLRNNLWVNPGEVAGDGLDNDGNGLADDIHGFNFIEETGIFEKGYHGTLVAGIIGAEGNNNLHVSGVNWHVKLMLHQANFLDQVAAGYYYAWEQKKRYLESNKKEGAFVVATNSSFGLDGRCGDPDFAEFFNVPYDSLGSQGVLSIASTANDTRNVDLVGDIPSSCSSDYLITVTNTNRMDAISNAAFGRETIDLGAPGTDIRGLSLDNGEISDSGTSLSCPQVTGAVALLYSLPCQKLANEAFSKPATTALQVKSAILEGVDPASALVGKTVSEGRLNVKNSMDLITAYCDIPVGPLQILGLKPNPVRYALTISYMNENFDPMEVSVWNSLGQKVFQETLYPERFGEREFTVDLPNWANGIYHIRLMQNNSHAVKSFFKI